MEGPQAAPVDHDQLPRLHLPHVLRVDQVQGAGLRAHDGDPAEPPQHEGPEAPGVARGHQGVPGQEEQGERAHDLGQAGRDRVLQPLAMAARIEVEDDLGVGGG